MELFTCKHLDVDPESGEWICEVSSKRPTGSGQIIVDSTETFSGQKVIFKCNVFGQLGARWMKEQITKKCDGARVVEAKIF